MSHHLDSPLARQDPRLDITDLYVFRGEHGTVFITNHSHSLAGVSSCSPSPNLFSGRANPTMTTVSLKVWPTATGPICFMPPPGKDPINDNEDFGD